MRDDSSFHRSIVIAVTSDRSLGLLTGFIETLAIQGWQVHLVSSPGSALVAYQGKSRITVHPLRMSRNPNLGQDFTSLISWIRLLRSLQPTVVYPGTPKASLLSLVAARIWKVPTRVYLVRGMPLSTAQGLKKVVLKSLEKLTVGCATHVLAVSHSLANEMITLGVVPRGRRVDVLGAGSSNGVDITRFSPADRVKSSTQLRQRHGIPAEAFVVGFVGRLTRDKGLIELALAAQRLAADRLELTLVIVGEVEQQNSVDVFQGLAGTTVQVVTVGRVADTVPYFHLFDLMVLPTLREGFPNVVLEAQASGTPVITTTATGAVDSVRDGETGLLVPPGDAEALAGAIARLAQDGQLRAQLAESGRARVVEAYERYEVQERYLTYLLQVSSGQ